MDYRSSDRHLDERTVSGLIAAQFPDLAGWPVTRFGAGWDNELFSAGEWIWRFPRRAERVPWFLREVQIMAVVAETLGPIVPVYERIGEPGDAFPYPFVGYRRLPGVGADRARVGDPGQLAADIGALFGMMHRVDQSRVPPTPAGWEHQPWAELRNELAAVADLIRPLLGPDLLSRAGPYLAGLVAKPDQDGPRRFIHNDICPDHLIIDPRSGRLNGLIDFTDAMVGEPVLDFVGLIGIGGYQFIDRVVARYDLPLGDGFAAKLEWLCRVLSLTWLADAAADDPAAIANHVSWVAAAFSR